MAPTESNPKHGSQYFKNIFRFGTPILGIVCKYGPCINYLVFDIDAGHCSGSTHIVFKGIPRDKLFRNK